MIFRKSHHSDRYYHCKYSLMHACSGFYSQWERRLKPLCSYLKEPSSPKTLTLKNVSFFFRLSVFYFLGAYLSSYSHRYFSSQIWNSFKKMFETKRVRSMTRPSLSLAVSSSLISLSRLCHRFRDYRHPSSWFPFPRTTAKAAIMIVLILLCFSMIEHYFLSPLTILFTQLANLSSFCDMRLILYDMYCLSRW